MPSVLVADEPIIKAPTSPTHTRRTSTKILNRNISEVVLGNLIFETWYYSPYPDHVIHGPDHHMSKPHAIDGEVKSDHHQTHYHYHGPSNQNIKTNETPACSRLHVCPYCFRYTQKVNDYVLHLQHHSQVAEQRTAESTPWQPVPASAIKVYDWNGYTIWDVDGEVEKLYCQNLSLFGKLFLEQKSVFFDTAGFHYFVLTYTPSTSTIASSVSPKTRGRKRTSSASIQLPSDLGLNTQVLGFFSKESLSWDANNLACILVFPPFQRRNLGQLLMAVSYKLSGWEWEDSIIGGPEKPLSAMGRRGYLRFWSERIARFMMGQTVDADGRKVFDRTRKRRSTFAREEMSIAEIGERTGMLAEDVIAALNEIGLCELMPPKRKRKKVSTGDATQSQLQEGSSTNNNNNNNNNISPVTTEEMATMAASMMIRRSQILEWADRHSVDLSSPVKEEGFLGEWALSDLATDDDDDSNDDDKDKASVSNVDREEKDDS